jgi:23S rRNA (adenine2503-C2)-methyltransferase
MTTPTAITGLSSDELEARLQQLGEPGYRAAQILDWIYAKSAVDFEAMTNLPAPLRKKLSESFIIDPLSPVEGTSSGDTTRKYLFRLHDGRYIETVLIPASPALYGERSDRYTLCVSSQVGCAYGCKFCASGLDGFTRNLNAGEITAQVLAASRQSGKKINNIVFMGMGEPLANMEHLLKAISIINAPWGIGIGARHMTVSTSGLAPQIRDFADQPLQIRLAVSLHGASDEVREAIMPVNKKYPIDKLLDSLRYYNSKKKQKITFEYILIEGINDSGEQARLLASMASSLKAKINLIPYNKVEGLQWNRPSESVQENFLQTLTSRGIHATLRREKGHDIEAACGQLRLRQERQEQAP